MPKMKSKRAACKRFKRTANGKILRHRSGVRHILTSKSKKRKRKLRRAMTLQGAVERRAGLQIGKK